MYMPEEWHTIIEQAQEDLPKLATSYDAPRLETVELAKYIDHTLLRLDATEEQIDHLCEEAKANDFKVSMLRLVFLQPFKLCYLKWYMILRSEDARCRLY